MKRNYMANMNVSGTVCQLSWLARVSNQFAIASSQSKQRIEPFDTISCQLPGGGV